MSTPEERLRERPDDRFAAPQHLLDLHAILKELREELHPAQHGHRQITVYHHERIAMVLFSFEEGGSSRSIGPTVWWLSRPFKAG